MKLLWLDLETTGLDPARGKILEVAAAVADLERPFDLGPFCTRVLPLGVQEHALMDDYVLSMHTKNGLLAECEDQYAERSAASSAGRRAGNTLTIVEDELLSLLPHRGTYDRENTPTLAGSSVHFDHAWLHVHMPTLAKRLSYRHYDVSAVKLFCRSLGMPKLPVAEAHRAEADVRESVAHAVSCARWLQAHDEWFERD